MSLDIFKVHVNALCVAPMINGEKSEELLVQNIVEIFGGIPARKGLRMERCGSKAVPESRA